MRFSMEVVPDRRTARSSRTASHSALGAASMCGPLRRDPQAGTSKRRDRHDSGSMIEECHSTSTTVTLAAWNRWVLGCPSPDGQRKRKPKLSAGVRQGPRQERTRHGCSRLKQ